MQDHLNNLKKKLYTIQNEYQVFLEAPDIFMSAILEDLKYLSLEDYQKFQSISYKNMTVSEAESTLVELNLLVSTLSQTNMNTDALDISIDKIKGVGPKIKGQLNGFGLSSIADLLFHIPFRYESLMSMEAEPDQKQLLIGIYLSSETIPMKGGKRVFRAHFKNDKAMFTGIWFRFSKRYPAASLKKDQQYFLYGELKQFYGRPSIFHPEFLSEEEVGKIRPVYSLPTPVSQKKYAGIIDLVLNQYKQQLPDMLPYRLVYKYGFPSVSAAVEVLHRPQSMSDADEIINRYHKAYQRFIFEELFYIQVGFLLQKAAYDRVSGIQFTVDTDYLNDIKPLMPFSLTAAQKRSLKDILNDMGSIYQMNRLIQGDVGSGKTIIAFIAALFAVQDGFQVAIIAPTEVLAEQHYLNFLDFAGDTVSTVLLTGGALTKQKTDDISKIASGHIDIIIGTHAVLQESVHFHRLGLAIIDEQHRFGVMQRKALIEKGYEPDILLMTATPIPRTLAISCYGDLDISIIDELPPGRIPITTRSGPVADSHKLFPFVSKEISKGHNIYVVYPLIDESEKMNLQSATEGFEMFHKQFGNQVTLLHGKMKSDEKKDIIDGFKSGHTRILISTTVIEVGIDMSDATVMVVMNAERFGLSQLHQLRGRVGRSALQSYCFLLHSKNLTEDGVKRIDAMCRYQDGFKLSEVDLEIRGPGDFFGTRQSGIPDLQFADILRDGELLQKARKDAAEIIKTDPHLERSENYIVKHAVGKKWQKTFDLINVG